MLSVLAQQIMDLEHCLLIVRHGRTAWNDEDRLTTSTDIPLVQRGQEQARKLGMALSGVQFDFASSSPLMRAYETAQLALAHHDKWDGKIVKDARLREPAAGPFEGLQFSALRDEGHALHHDFKAYQAEIEPVFPEGCETVENSAALASSFLDDVASTPGRHFAATHGAFGRILCCNFLGLPPAAYRRLKMENCHAALFRFYPQAPHQLIGWNLAPC